MGKRTNIHHGSDFTKFLREEGIYEEVEAAAIKKVISAALAACRTLALKISETNLNKQEWRGSEVDGRPFYQSGPTDRDVSAL